MQFQMTERDKRLLVFLAIFVILAVGGYWGIYPAVSGIQDTDQQIEEALELRDQNEIKIAQKPMLEADNQKLEAELVDLRADFFPMMTSAQVDRYLTGMVLQYDLYAYDLDIEMPEQGVDAVVEPYQYAKIEDGSAEQEMSAAEEVESYTAGAEGEDADETAESEPEAVADVPTGIRQVTVSMRVGGGEEDIQRLIDALSKPDEKLHLISYSWGEESSISDTDDGDYEVSMERTLTMGINLYMCEGSNGNTQ